MTRTAPIAAMLAGWCGIAAAQAPPEEPQPLACMPPARARQVFFEEKLVPPVRAMRQAALLGDAEAIEIQLCRFQSGLVYDVTLLGRDGRVVHRLMSATTGSPLGGRGKSGP